ncbi:hypothetical protein G6F63_015738 [Rhizopus arrhizus]|nr:hypothetical protein G6F63_015738 [Rhizopus arrhizus]
MTGVDHYRPGIAAAALAHAQYAEIIPDLQHIHPGVIRLAARAIPRLYAVTDATAATGMPDGEYALGEQRVHKRCATWCGSGWTWLTPRNAFPPSRPTTSAWAIAAASRPPPAPPWWCGTPSGAGGR